MKITLALIGSAGFLACSTIVSHAAVVCNEEGDCWRTTQRYEYRPEHRVTIHDDVWKLEKQYRLREDREEHKKRGYYKSGVWIEF